MSAMIIEGICTTTNLDGSLNIAPMGPVVDLQLTTFLFRPYQTSTTFQNLKRERSGVFHVVDDVLLIARLVTKTLSEIPDTFPALEVPGQVLADCSRWYEFEVLRINDSSLRSEIETRVVNVGQRREFWGFNRAKHAVLEAAILVTRLHLLPQDDVLAQFRILGSAVEKTGGADEREAFHLLGRFANQHWAHQRPE